MEKIKVLTSYHGKDWEEIGEKVSRTKEIYCGKHDYDFICDKELILDAEFGYWNKAPLILKHLNDCDWLFWTETDSIIINQELPLQAIIYPIQNENIIISQDFCSGNFLVKNTPFVKELLSTIVAEYHKKYSFDLKLLMKYRRDRKLHNLFKFVHPTILNASINPLDLTYRDGDFLIHLAGMPNQVRFSILKWLAKVLYEV